jgi:hypothetical protein
MPLTTTIDNIQTLPGSPYNGSGLVGIVITNGIPTFFKVTGSNLDRIVSVNWYPEHAATVQFKKRDMILVDNTTGTFMIMVTDNYLYDTDRGGHISFRLDDGTTLTSPVKTFGRISVSPLWTSPDQGLNTG